jgi:hypothetical protein
MTKTQEGYDLSIQDRWMESKRIRAYEAEERKKALILEREGPDFDETLDFGKELKFTHEERPVKVHGQKKKAVQKKDPTVTKAVIMTVLAAGTLIYIFLASGI